MSYKRMQLQVRDRRNTKSHGQWLILEEVCNSVQQGVIDHPPDKASPSGCWRHCPILPGSSVNRVMVFSVEATPGLTQHMAWLHVPAQGHQGGQLRPL
jgi:hypothetical protein